MPCTSLLVFTALLALSAEPLQVSAVPAQPAAETIEQQQQAKPRYAHRPYGEIVAEMQRLEAAHPGFVELYNAQERYGLASPGTCLDDKGMATPCKTWVLRITNEATLPTEGRDRPEVFFSGCLHGDEWVGPSSMVELALYLVRTRAAERRN